MGRWSKEKNYWGTFLNSAGVHKRAYLSWNKDKGGYVLRDENDKVLIPSAFPTLVDMSQAGVKFTHDESLAPEPTTREGIAA